jgi:hypothetical protein
MKRERETGRIATVRLSTPLKPWNGAWPLLFVRAFDVTKFYGANGAKMPQSVVFAIQQ